MGAGPSPGNLEPATDGGTRLGDERKARRLPPGVPYLVTVCLAMFIQRLLTRARRRLPACCEAQCPRSKTCKRLTHKAERAAPLESRAAITAWARSTAQYETHSRGQRRRRDVTYPRHAQHSTGNGAQEAGPRDRAQRLTAARESQMICRHSASASSVACAALLSKLHVQRQWVELQHNMHKRLSHTPFETRFRRAVRALPNKEHAPITLAFVGRRVPGAVI
ncbi:hypothetical protein PSPO01_08049 [Paraphaeosphaeria sporulosa]